MLTGIRRIARRTGERGFTLIEIVVVLAVIALLAAALAPTVIQYFEDAKKAKAETEVKVIAAALSSLTKDLRHYPAYTGTNNSGPAEIELLCGPGKLPEVADNVKWPTFTSGSECTTTGKIDTLEDILIKNTPLGAAKNAFNTTGRERGQWRGPYGERFPVDPWERAYVVNIKNGAVDKDDPDSLKKVIWVLSPGPNGVIDTPANSLMTSGELVPGGDDIAVRIK